MAASRLRFREVADYRPLIAGEPPAFEPGNGWRYSNSGDADSDNQSSAPTSRSRPVSTS